MPIIIVILVVAALILLWPVLCAIAEFISALVAFLSAMVWILIGVALVGGAIALCVKGGKIGRIVTALFGCMTLVYLLWGDSIKAYAKEHRGEADKSQEIQGPQQGIETLVQQQRIEKLTDFSSLNAEANAAKREMYNSRLAELKAARKQRFDAEKKARFYKFDAERRRRSAEEAKRLERLRTETEANERLLQYFQQSEENSNGSSIELRRFALQESPVLWETIQQLKADVQYRDSRIEEYKRIARTQNVDLNHDADYLKICRSRNILARSLRSINNSLNNAYFVKKRHDASVSDEDLNGMLKKAITDGMEEATQIIRRIKDLDGVMENSK